MVVRIFNPNGITISLGPVLADRRRGWALMLRPSDEPLSMQSSGSQPTDHDPFGVEIPFHRGGL